MLHRQRTTQVADGSNTNARPVRHLRRGHPLGVLRNSQYRRYWAAGFATFTGFNMQMLIRGWMMYELTQSPFMVTMVTAAMMMPMLFLSLVGGALADRVDRKMITMASDVTLLASFIALFGISAAGIMAPWHIIAISVVNGIAFSMAVSARQALISGLVHREQMRTAVGLSATTYNSAQIIGPAIGGVMLPIVGATWALAVSAIVVVPAIVLYSSLKPVHHASANDAQGSIVENVKAGLAYAFQNSTLRFLMLGAMVMILTVGPFQSLMPVFAEDVLHVGAGGLGVLMLAAGVGALVGSISVVAIGESVGHQKLELIFGLLGAAALAGFALSPWYALSIPLVTVTAFATTGFMVVNMTVVQISTPDYIRGRVVSVRFLVIGLMPFGALSMGGAAESLGAPTAVAIIAVIGAIGFALVQIASRIFSTPDSQQTPSNS
ncbi:MFS transporter [Candidatus Lucifugimonas marina]|uniref:MFS transporter n=1 Tax=Candidatus Lucifugimonas marina TaxID=3038979 RepID=A0AAJ5ZI48_9CHLR|nr:MFS transporter [SAR202 cluster bacterium JH702]MDG0870578.1 MFS transporter [SAR202 cluster bacterium JH639]WFG35881.1 MFS transporter [SAR202 cluster bacterium JH545]WFG39825.1 MFS transporter [SAR202 cluster bacterium JH1073]